MSDELLSGTVTFLFTDIEGSTQLVRTLRDGYTEVLDAHGRLLQDAFDAHGGRLLDTQGDAFFVAFGRAKDAVDAAVAGQRALAGHAWPGDGEVRVRMGLHTGEPVVGEGRYVGLGVHRAARICSAGHGGQVLLSAATCAVVEDDLPEEWELRDLGQHQLKDLPRPEHLFQLAAPGLVREFPPLRAAAEGGEDEAGTAPASGYRILGPLEVWDEGNDVSPAGAKPRALLALLLLHPNEVVPADRLIDELWGEDPPEKAGAALRVNVSRVRKALPRDVLATRSPGYLIRVDADELDLHRFERLVEDGRNLLSRGLAAEASERLREALSLWRGAPLAEFSYESFAQSAINRLQEIRLAAVELRIDAELRLGRHDALVGELEALVAEHPLRERLQEFLMTALYRSGRQAEALDAYRDARRALVDGLGIEPSARLQELERAILRQDRALELEAEAPAPSARVQEAEERSVLVAVAHENRADVLLAVAEAVVRHPPRVLILARLVPDEAELSGASSWLEERRSALVARGVAARSAAFTATAPGEELARLATELDVELLLADAPDVLLDEGAPDEQFTAVLEQAPCDVALLVRRDRMSEGPVLVPFGGAEHDWAAVELGAQFARSTGVALRLAGAAAAPEQGKRDASRLLSHGALAVQRVLGISTESLLTPPGEDGMLEASREAGLLVVGLSTRWHREGIGPARLRLAREAAPPTLLVRRGHRPGGLAPPAALTRFTWSIRA